MRVLFPLHLFYPSKVGGPANTLYWLCKALARNGHEVTVVATREGIDDGRVETNKWVDVDGIKVRYCDSTSKFSLDVIRYSKKVLKSVDTVVFSSICFLPNFFIAIAARLKGKRILWSPRGELFDSAVQGGKGKKLYFTILNTLLGKSIVFHATSDAEKKVILSYFPNSEVVIVPNYMEVPPKEIVNTDYTDFVYVGRIAPIKAIDKMIGGLDASKLFRRSNSRMIIVGGVEKQFEDYYNSLLVEVERLGLNDKIVFVGSKTGRDKFKMYAAARYSFLVSNSENFGNVVIEALSQGTPVVASKGTPWESLDERKAGYWIENTPVEIGRIIDVILQQSEENYLEFRENAFVYSKSFDVFEHIGDWESVL